jgi:hypothetical protein
MNMLRNSRASLRDALNAAADLAGRSLIGAEASTAWSIGIEHIDDILADLNQALHATLLTPGGGS